jgi:hypothetical protein
MIPDVAHPVALPLLGLAAGGWEGAKALGLTGGISKLLGGGEESTSPASMDNVLAALVGFQRGSKTLPGGMQEGGEVPKAQTGLALPMQPAMPIPGRFNPEMGPAMQPIGFEQGQRSFDDTDLLRDNARGGFAAMTAVDPMRQLEDRFNSAKARVDLLSALSARAPAAARLKLSGLLQNAAFEMQEAEKPINAIRAAMISSDLQRQQDEASMAEVLAQNAGELEKTLAAESARTERETEAAKTKQEAEIFTSAGKNDAGFMPQNARDAVAAYRRFMSGEPEPQGSVTTPPEALASPEAAIAFLRSLEGKMSQEEVRTKYADVIAVARGGR